LTRRAVRRSSVPAVAVALAAALGVAAPRPSPAQSPTRAVATPAARRTILAVGAHAGDMELTCGAVLLAAHQRGDRVVILHLTLGEEGNPKLPPAAYGAQKRREAEAVAAELGAEVRFGPYEDGELPDDEAARRYVADVIRQVKPDYVLTHWRESIHRDHATTNAVVRDAVLLAALAGVETGHPAHRGVRGLWYTDNWEDADQFKPFLYVDVSAALPTWRTAVERYEFARGGISGFPYVEYYAALATVRGAVAHKGRAVAFGVEPAGERRVLDSLP
jgi:LmbE family N-acetylglucosaminyl deacetylase